MTRRSGILIILPRMAAAFARGLNVTSGARACQAFQRDASNSAAIRVEGTARGAAGKAVEARLIFKGRALAGFDWKQAGTVRGGRFTAEMASVPVGGPYRIDLQVAGTQVRRLSTICSSAISGFWQDSRT